MDLPYSDDVEVLLISIAERITTEKYVTDNRDYRSYEEWKETLNWMEMFEKNLRRLRKAVEESKNLTEPSD